MRIKWITIASKLRWLLTFKQSKSCSFPIHSNLDLSSTQVQFFFPVTFLCPQNSFKALLLLDPIRTRVWKQAVRLLTTDPIINDNKNNKRQAFAPRWQASKQAFTVVSVWKVTCPLTKAPCSIYPQSSTQAISAKQTALESKLNGYFLRVRRLNSCD
jgi:hypothetical protein